MLHQTTSVTHLDRYPHIFKVVVDSLFDVRPVVLSFGCSTGEEIVTIQNYMPLASTWGCDINPNSLEICRNKFGKQILSYEEFLEDSTAFNVIFAMSVLCRWEDTESVDDSSDIYPFAKFEAAINIFDDKLLPGGLLVIYNANYCFKDTTVSANYLPVQHETITESGSVHKFNRENKKTSEIYKDVIFRKN